MKQTAVEWLENQIKTSKYYYKLMAEIKSRSTIVQPNIFEQAKEMEKEQIIEAHFHGCERGEMFNNENRAFITDSEQYYNETFKSEQ